MQNDGSITISNPPSGNGFSTADDVSPLRQFFHNKWVRLIIVIDIIAIITVIAILISNNTRTATISLNITPVDASIQIGATGGGILMALITFTLVPMTSLSPARA